MIVLAIGAGLLAGTAAPSGSAASYVRSLGALCAWAAALLLWRALAPAQARQCAALALSGLAAFVVATIRTGAVPANAVALFDANLALVAMITAVGFIRLASAALPTRGGQGPRGSRALLHTLAGTALLGGAINITALVIIADRITTHGALSLRDASWLTRAFTLAALYSPFIAGMAFALNVAPVASLATVYGADDHRATRAAGHCAGSAAAHRGGKNGSTAGWARRPGATAHVG